MGRSRARDKRSRVLSAGVAFADTNVEASRRQAVWRETRRF